MNAFTPSSGFGSDTAMDSFVNFDMGPATFGLSAMQNDDSNDDLNRFFNGFATPGQPQSANNAMFGSSIQNDQFFNTAGQFPFPQQAVDPTLVTADNNSKNFGNYPELTYGNQDLAGQSGNTVSSTAAAAPRKRNADAMDEGAPEPPKKRKPRRKKNPPSEKEQMEKKQKFLERNRNAARKCREKKKDWVSNLQDKFTGLQRVNHQLVFEHSQILDELTSLKQLLTVHATCDNKEIATWLEGEQKNIELNGPRFSHRALSIPQSEHSWDDDLDDQDDEDESMSRQHSMSRQGSPEASRRGSEIRANSSHNSHQSRSSVSSGERPDSSNSLGDDKLDSGISSMGTPPDEREKTKKPLIDEAIVMSKEFQSTVPLVLNAGSSGLNSSEYFTGMKDTRVC